MQPSFSFNYRGARFSSADIPGEATPIGTVYRLEEGISVRVCRKDYPLYDAAEWVLYFENDSTANSGIFSDIWDCDAYLEMPVPAPKRAGYMPKEGDACIITMNGTIDGALYCESDEKSTTEFIMTREYLDRAPERTKSFSNIGGRSSDGYMPFFDITALGSGYIAAIGWTGDWKASFTAREDGFRIRTGLKETHFYLKPGEKLRTTSILLMRYSENEDKHNKFRRLIRNHFSHIACTPATREGIMASELWGGISSEEMKKRIREFYNHGVQFEEFWIDAGWYGNCTNCEDTFSGDWSANPRVHPDSLRDVSRCAEETGSGMMLWIEIERAIRGTPILTEHPDWFLQPEAGDSFILNLGNEEALKYACNTVAGWIEDVHMSCFREDSNAELTRYFARNDESDRRGITEIKHIMGLYRMWEYLTSRFPGLVIDNCASGGRRIDIEALKRTVLFFRSDYQCNFNENPEVLQVHNSNICHYIPLGGCTSKTKSDTYAIRSSYSPSWGGAFYNTVFQSMGEDDFLWAKKITEEYRRIRHYLSRDYYNHGSLAFDDTSWAIWQYHDPETDSGIVMAFRRSNSPFSRVDLQLRGMNSTAKYRFENLNTGDTEAHTSTFTLTLPEKRTSVILEYSR